MTALKERRVPMMMSDQDVRDIDDWMFAHRLRSRSEAIRQLVRLGLEKSCEDSITATAHRLDTERLLASYAEGEA